MAATAPTRRKGHGKHFHQRQQNLNITLILSFKWEYLTVIAHSLRGGPATAPQPTRPWSEPLPVPAPWGGASPPGSWASFRVTHQLRVRSPGLPSPARPGPWPGGRRERTQGGKGHGPRGVKRTDARSPCPGPVLLPCPPAVPRKSQLRSPHSPDCRSQHWRGGSLSGHQGLERPVLGFPAQGTAALAGPGHRDEEGPLLESRTEPGCSAAGEPQHSSPSPTGEGSSSDGPEHRGQSRR